MDMNHNCRVCSTPLVVGENVTQKQINRRQYICRLCHREYQREYVREHREHVQERRREYYQEHREHIREYDRERTRKRMHRTGQHLPMDENRECPVFLGVYVAEQVLSHVFKNVERMPYGNPGFDFICGGGHKIDVKSSCRRVSEKKADNWMFGIRKNKIAEYFLCLAFDNRESLNPEYIWMMPATDVNNYTGISISESRLDKWDRYALDIDKVSACCSAMKNNQEAI